MQLMGEKYSMPIINPLTNMLFYHIKCAMGLKNNVILAVINPIIIYIHNDSFANCAI